MTLFSVGEEVNHHVDDPDCPACWGEYPEACTCGGFIHAAPGEADEEGDVALETCCDHCGRTEEGLDTEIELGLGAP